MKKIFLTFALALAITTQIFATTDIANNVNTADCDNDTLGATTGTSNLQAKWTPNTLNLQWVVDGEEYTPTNSECTTCRYDGSITIPSNEPSKIGYTFAGWGVKAAAPEQTAFDLSTLDVNINGTAKYYHRENNQGVVECRHDASGSLQKVDCSDPSVSDLALNEWKVDFSYGTVNGIVRCSKVSGKYAKIGSPTDDWKQSGANYCWCQITNFKPLNGSSVAVVYSPWVYRNEGVRVCEEGCAIDCADTVKKYSSFRTPLYGITQ